MVPFRVKNPNRDGTEVLVATCPTVIVAVQTAVRPMPARSGDGQSGGPIAGSLRAGQGKLVRASALPASSVKFTRSLKRVPTSAITKV